jgi:hypothetical protein
LARLQQPRGLRLARAVIDTKGPVLRLPEAIDRLAAACLALVSRMPLAKPRRSLCGDDGAA